MATSYNIHFQIDGNGPDAIKEIIYCVKTDSRTNAIRKGLDELQAQYGSFMSVVGVEVCINCLTWSKATVNLLLFAKNTEDRKFVFGSESYIFQSIGPESSDDSRFIVHAYDNAGKKVELFCRVRN